MNREKKQRRRYSDEFKCDAVALVTEQGYSLLEAGRSLGVNHNLIHKWQKKLHSGPNGTPILKISEQEELKRLRKEVTQLRMETDILKKAAAYFAKGI